MGKGSHDPQADEPAKLAARTLTMKRSASRDLLGDALDCAASCIDAAALDAYRLDYASSASAPVIRTLLYASFSPPPRCQRVVRRAAGHGVATDAPNLCKSTPTRATPPLPARLRSCVGRDPKKALRKHTHRAAHAVAAPPANRKKRKKTQVSTGSDARREGRTAVGQRRQGRHDSKRI